jgi:hypothetical protein
MHTEVIACIKGARAAVQLGIARICLETDALQVKLALSSSDYRLAILGGRIYELKELLHDGFADAGVTQNSKRM